MRDLTVVGLSEDRQFVVLRGSAGEEFQVPADARLRATLRDDRARLGQLEIAMDSALRPKDIQARIRRGESPEAVADAAHVPVAKIMGYAVPVLAEREHVAERARSATIRRRHTQTDAVSLGDVVDAALGESGADPAAATWDSWRREDGRWTVAVTSGSDVATYLFDSPGRYVVAEDEVARRLIGDVVSGPDSTDMAIAAAVSSGLSNGEPDSRVTSLKHARERRALAQEQLVLDADDLTAPETTDATQGPSVASDRSSLSAEDAESTVDLTRTAAHVRAAANTAADDDATADAATVGAATVVDQAVGDEQGRTDDARRGGKRRERRRVPSWDEIMFGDRTARE